MTLNDLIDRYLAWAATYYLTIDAGDGRTRSQTVQKIERAVRDLRTLYGATPAAEFGPAKLKALRQHWIADKQIKRYDTQLRRSRTYLNQLAQIVCRMFRWAASEELLPSRVWHDLRAVEGLRRGRSEAAEGRTIGPAPAEHVDAVLPVVRPLLRCLIQLHRLTGARSGELLQLRGADIDRAGPVWEYRPPRHKTQLHGHQRVIYFGPQAQALLAAHLPADPNAWVFTGRRGGRLSTGSYGHVVRSACLRAGVPRWHPHQLRHSKATELRRVYGLDAARVILGHSSIDQTVDYAELDRAEALRIVREAG